MTQWQNKGIVNTGCPTHRRPRRSKCAGSLLCPAGDEGTLKQTDSRDGNPMQKSDVFKQGSSNGFVTQRLHCTVNHLLRITHSQIKRVDSKENTF